MDDLIKRIENFLEKQKMPFDQGSKIPSQQLTGFRGKRQRRKPRRRIFKPGDVVGEISTQLTPKGPYGSPSDIASDIKESGSLARRITGIKKPEKPKALGDM